DNGRHALAKPVAPKRKCKAESDFKVKLQFWPADRRVRTATVSRFIRVALAACPPVSAACRSTRVARPAEQARQDIGLPASNAMKQVRPPSHLDSSSLERSHGMTRRR